MKTPTFAIAVVFQIKPSNVSQFQQRVLQQAKDSVEKEPGCSQFDVLQDEASPNTFFLYETYINAQAFEEHKQTAHFFDFNQTVTPWIETKEVRRLNLLQENR